MVLVEKPGTGARIAHVVLRSKASTTLTRSAATSRDTSHTSHAKVDSIEKEGLLSVTRAVLPFMRANRSGHVINIFSIGGYREAAGFGMGSSTGFAVEGITESLRDKLKLLDIHAAVVEPGYFRTVFLDASSLTVAPDVIADCDGTSGAVRREEAQINHKQPDDPKKLSQAMVTLVDATNPPLQIPLGVDRTPRSPQKMLT